MSEIKICRVCLRTSVKLYKYDRFLLRNYYEEIMCVELNQYDELPQYFCYECATLLHKFHKFKEKCQTAELSLKEVLWTGKITLDAVSKLKGRHVNLYPELDVITVTQNVKTYVERHKSIFKSKAKTKLTQCTEPPQHIIVNVQSDLPIEPIKNDDDDDDNDNNYDNLEPDFHIDNDNEVDEKNIDQIEEEKPKEIPKVDDVKLDDSENIACVDEPVVEAKEVDDDERVSDDASHSNHNKNKTKVKSKSRNLIKKKKMIISDANRFESRVKKTQELDSRYWHKSNLSEEEAVKEFQEKALDPKYVNAVYKCTGCLKGFSKEDMMKRHIKLRHSESNGSVECRFCRIRFKWKSLLSRHIREHYNKYKCLRCDLVFCRETSAHHHNQYHNGVIRTCEYCGDIFTHPSTYYTHLRKHRSKHLCTLCGESFVSEFGLYMHRRVKHIMESEKQDKPPEDITFCERCDVNFETRKAYEEHLIHSAMHSATEETAAMMTFKAGSVTRRAPRKQTACKICNKNFSTLVAYTKHHHTEHPEVPLSIAPNGKPNSSFYASQSQKQICEICGALLAPNSIYSHMNTHTRQRQYTCATCGMQFNAKGTLQRHYLTHTGEKPVECTLCDKRFTQQASMKLHYRTIHLKQPYPKRNRKKKSEEQEEAALLAEFYQNNDGSDDIPLDRWRSLRL